jgi:excisionase family DNA binding protein
MTDATTVPADWRSRACLRPRLVATILGVSLRQVRRLIANGELRSVRIGAVRLVPVPAVLELVGEQAPSLAAPDAPRLLRDRARQALGELERRVG